MITNNTKTSNRERYIKAYLITKAKRYTNLQIKEAKAAGDTQKVAELKKQLKTTHQENVQQKKKDKKELKGAKKELRQDKKAAKHTRS